jgi:hypothetical protein
LPCSVERVRRNSRDSFDPVRHFSCDHERSQFLGNAVASLLLLCHSDIAY